MNPLVTYTLDTDKLDGNAAEVKSDFAGTDRSSWGSLKVDAITITVTAIE